MGVLIAAFAYLDPGDSGPSIIGIAAIAIAAIVLLLVVAALVKYLRS